MYQNQINNLNRITAYYGYPSNNTNSNTKNFDDSNNASLYSVRKTGDDTLNKSQSSPKSPNTSEILIQNIGGKVGDLSKEVSRLMQINDKLIADISALNTQNHNKDFLIKSLQERLNLIDSSSNSARLVQNANQQQIIDYNQYQINHSKIQEKEDVFQQQKITNINTLQPRSGISPNLYVNNMLNPNQNQNVTNLDGKEDNQRYLLSSLQVNTDVAENTTNFLFNSGFSQSGKNSAKHAQQVQQISYEKTNGYNQNQTNNITSPWSLYQQDEKVNQIQMNAPSFSNNNATINNVNNQAFNDQQIIRNSQQNKQLMLASFQDKQSASSEQVNNFQSQFSLFQEELENVKREKAQLEMNYNDLKQKYEDQQKEHAREIAQLKTNMFNSVVESDNYSKYDEDPLFNIENIKKQLDKNTSELVKSIEIDEKMIEGRFNKKDNTTNIFNNNSFSASKEKFIQKSSTSNKFQGVSDHQTNLVVSQEIPSNKNLDKMGHSQQNIVVSSEFEKTDFKNNQEQFIKRNSLKQGTLNGVNLHKDNTHLIDILDQLEQAKKENTNLKYELKLVKEELLFISAKDTQAHSKNEQLRIIVAKFKLEQEEEIMKFKIQNEELQSELKKLNSLNKNLQNEIIKLKEGLQSHQRSSTIMDEKTLENLFDSEIESEGEDLEDDGYGDRDSKQIRKHKNDILNTMTNNEKIYNKIVYLKRKNRRLEDQLEEWKRQYWLLEKSTQNNNYQSQNNNNKNNNNNKKPNNNNQNHPPQLIQQNSQGSSQEKSSLFEFNFSQFLQYQQRASQESKKQVLQQVQQLPQEMNEINEISENTQKENKLDSSTFSKNEAISQCDTPAIGISVNQGKAEQTTPQMNFGSPSNEVTNPKSNKNNLIDYTNISNLIINQQQNNIQQEKSASQLQTKQNDFTNISPKSANLNNNKINFSNEQFYKQTSFSNYNPYSLNSNYQIQKIDQYLYKPVTQFSPSQKIPDQIQSQNDQINNHIHQIKEEKKQLEKGVISTIKDIRDQVNQLQKRKIKNAPQFQSHQQQIINQITKQNNKLQVQQQNTTSQKIFNDQLYQNKTLNSDYQKQHQSTSGLIHLEQKTSNSTTKVSHLINNFKKLNLEKSQSPIITSDQKNNNLNQTSINSNNTSQNIGNFTCQTDRQILYNNSNQNNVQSQPSLNQINQYQLTNQQKNLNKIAQTAATTPKMSNTKQSTSVHYAQNNQQIQQYQQIKQVLHTQPNLTNHQEKTNFNNRQSANLSYETTKSQMNNLNKSTSPINSTKTYPKQIEQSYSNNFIYQKTKFNQRIKDKYN
ncbi:hypothetical protein TTHERM_00204130 (macronuclear) [Tetrahymena thermophila SB210]|uniref:Uncharacterized protein n=1 Tax=Tetrahymena thermophila (strain SB210) TaxID=312017 RepID=Q22ND1_TETTS|nr:hypothetical protein TTHERM_00204130 [Tetrahymena thermophila SB210]EAR86854.1 hypothetical protein TTHERM_00204130 [Tetrahymena thermophila SB210]|eukprot:XP_001007099.1 hypothetical protein TTHERM_00204130 [Tetrahymena thermophila SB210]